jgi:hypothetical protein
VSDRRARGALSGYHLLTDLAEGSFMPTDDTPDALEEERRLREREQAVSEKDPHERPPSAGSGDPLDDDDEERKAAPPGPEAQQPRG